MNGQKARASSLTILTGLYAVMMLLTVPELRAIQGPADSYEAVYEALVELHPTSQRAAVQGLEIAREGATFNLADGTIYPLSPVNGRTPGMVFIGEGSFAFEPPSRVEREALARRADSTALDVPIRGVVFLFGDSTWERFSQTTSLVEGDVERPARGYVNDLLDLVSDKRHEYFRSGPLATFLNDVREEMFVAFVIAESGGPYMFEVDPFDLEQVQIYTRARRGQRKGELEVVTQNRSAESRRSVESATHREMVAVDRYTIHSTIERNLDFSAVAEFDVRSKLSGYTWVPFYLYYQLEVDSIRTGAGAPVTFFRGEENGTAWVRFEPTLDAGDVRTLRVYYHGELIREQSSWFYMLSSLGWYPRHGEMRDPATFDLTFTYPDRLRLVAVGDAAEQTHDGSNVTMRWVTPEPIRYASFNVGRFTEYALEYPGIPRTVILKQEEGHSELRTRFLTGAGMERAVGRDVANAMTFYEWAFGDPITDHIWATEIPFGHGQGFPGLLHLSYATFWDEDQDEEILEVFRAHEVAHQWWGNGVSHRTYRDQWLDEGLADYSALLFLRNVQLKPDKFEDILDDYRKEILRRRDEAGPIALGRRNATSEHPEDYSTIVYKKGAWVAHMLRAITLDLASQNDDAFITMMRDFYTTHRSGLVSTDDLQTVVENHLGTGMGWFFDQWVRGTDIPTYEFAHDVASTDNGDYEVHVRIAQKDVPETFLMFVPLAVEADDGTTAWFRLMVKGPMTEGVIPVPFEPKEVRFNAGNAVLADVKNVRW